MRRQRARSAAILSRSDMIVLWNGVDERAQTSPFGRTIERQHSLTLLPSRSGSEVRGRSQKACSAAILSRSDMLMVRFGVDEWLEELVSVVKKLVVAKESRGRTMSVC